MGVEGSFFHLIMLTCFPGVSPCWSCSLVPLYFLFSFQLFELQSPLFQCGPEFLFGGIARFKSLYFRDL